MDNIEKLIGEKLSKVLIKRNAIFESTDNHIFADEIYFVFKNDCLYISPITESDEIGFEILNISENKSLDQLENILLQFNDKKLGEFWNCTNSRDYFDAFILGFDRLHPSIIILSEGSVLKIFQAKQN